MPKSIKFCLLCPPPTNVSSPLQIKDLVELVQKARMAKVLAGLSTLQGAMTVKLNNLAAMEINAVRPFFLGALDMFHEYQKVCSLSRG